MTDIQKLKALAEAATPGPWECREAEGSSAVCWDRGWVADSGTDRDIADNRFIAAANPAAVLELIAEIELVTSENQRLRAGVDEDLAEIDRIQAAYDELFRSKRNYRMQRDQAKDESDKLKAENEALRELVRLFSGAAYPVCTSIDTRGYRWSEAYLDQALESAVLAIGKEARP